MSPQYWLRLIDTNADNRLNKEPGELEQEATELMNVFGAIIRKTS
jgi:hypothetical protein